MVLVLYGLILPTGKAFQVQAQTGGSNGFNKLATPLQKLLNGQITSETSWYKSNTQVPFVQVLIQTYPSDTAPLRQAVKSVGGTVWSRYYSINAIDGWIPVSKLLLIANRPDVEKITPNYMTQQSKSDLEKVTGASTQRVLDSTTNDYVGVDGTGVGIAILDSGLMASNQGFNDGDGNSRVKAQVDTVQQNAFLQAFKESRFLDSVPYQGKDYSQIYFDSLTASGVSFLFRNFLPNADKYGHGTHVAGIAAGRGNGENDDSDVTGMAPNANIISVKVLDNEGVGQVSDVIKGIDWTILHKNEYNIRIINLSLGGSSTESYLTDPLCRAVRKAVSEGIVVVVSAGNYGKDLNGTELYGTITSPANDPTVITVGSANTFQTDNRSDDRVNTFSSRGPTRGYYVENSESGTGRKVYDNLIKPDLVAPGNKIISLESAGNLLASRNVSLSVTDENTFAPVMQMSGTSVSAPVVSGTVALLLQKNPGLTPPLVKAILQYTSQQISGANLVQQGAGLLNVKGALRLSEVLRTDIGTAVANGTLKTGDSMLAVGKSMPSSNDSINGSTVYWGRYIFAGGTHILGGSSLFTKYQAFYNPKMLWVKNQVKLNDQIAPTQKIISSGVNSADFVADRKVLTLGTDLSTRLRNGQGIILSDGIMLSDGIILSDGIMLSDGIILGDGIMLSDGIILSDGIMLSDGIILSDGLSWWQGVLRSETFLLGE